MGTQHNTQSDKIIEELVEAKIIPASTDRDKLGLILRKYLCESYADGMYHQNHKNYIETKKK